MSVIYLLPTLPPKNAQVEAIAQEVGFLQQHFGLQADGHPDSHAIIPANIPEIIHVNPNVHLPRPLIPRLAFGWHKLPYLRRLAHHADLFHFFNPDPFPYPFLLTLPKPVIYTITAGLHGPSLNLAYFRRMAMITVPDARTLVQLQRAGLTNVALQPPAIDTARFTHTPTPLPPGTPLHLLVASAPWTEAQFATKGFDALLAAVQATPELHLTLLWRGLLVEVIHQRIAMLGIDSRVTVIDDTVDVNAILARVHAAAIFATAPGILKAYPHSLLDALAAGKPVLLNRTIPMSDYVDTEGCGVVVDAVTPAAIATGIAALRANYDHYAQNARTVGQRDFTHAAAHRTVAAIYANARQQASTP